MSSDLTERYNEGIVPPPDLSEDVPQLRRPSEQAASGQGLQSPVLWIVAIIVVLFLVCLVVAGGTLLFLGR